MGMLFPIDLVFLDHTHSVVHTEEDVRPFRVSKIVLKAESVLELPASTIHRTGTRVGDLLEIENVSKSERPATRAAGA
jgi:uncharacterized protein